MVPTSAPSFSLATDATQPIRKACVEINNLFGTFKDSCRKVQVSCDMYCICTMVYTIEMAAAQIEVHMNAISGSNSRTGTLLCRKSELIHYLSGGSELVHYSVGSLN